MTNPVRPSKVYVHERQVRMFDVGKRQCLRRIPGQSDDLLPERLKMAFEVDREQDLILDDEHP